MHAGNVELQGARPQRQRGPQHMQWQSSSVRGQPPRPDPIVRGGGLPTQLLTEERGGDLAHGWPPQPLKDLDG